MRPLILLAGLVAPPAWSAPPTPEAPFELVLHDPTGRPKPSQDCDTRLCTSLLELLDSASTSIDFAVYGFRGQPAISKALQDAKARGVTVRGVVDRTVDGKNYYADTDALVAALGTVTDDLATDRRSAANDKPFDPSNTRCWLPRPEGHQGPLQCNGFDLGDRCLIGAQASRDPIVFEGDIMHDKFFVVDGRYVWMGSTNVSDSGTGGYNANVVGVWNSPEVAAWYTAEIEQMLAGTYHDDKRSQGRMRAELAGGITVEGYFSPQDRPMTKVVRKLVQEAEERIDVGIFFLTHKGITADLLAAHQRGVKVRVILDATAATNEYTKHEVLRTAGIPLKIEAWGGKMHMKAAAIDGEVVVLGSMNWTSAGEWGNDENTLVVRSTAHAAQFHTFYDTLWSHVPDVWLQGRPDPESKDSTTACTDGSDNDFDHLEDADDPGCGKNPPPLAALAPWTIVPKGPDQGLVKGNISRDGKRTYYIPTDSYYDRVEINEAIGEQWFCSEEAAKDAGFKRAYGG